MSTTYGLREKKRYMVWDGKEGRAWYGLKTEWFIRSWQKIIGNGPAVLGNIVLYTERDLFPSSVFPIALEVIRTHMESGWQAVRPVKRPLPDASCFLADVKSWADLRRRRIATHVLHLPAGKDDGERAAAVRRMLKSAFEKDMPAALLCRDRGTEKDLSPLRWTMVVSVEEAGPERTVLTVLDNGEMRSFCLENWLSSMHLAGELIWFEHLLGTPI